MAEEVARLKEIFEPMIREENHDSTFARTLYYDLGTVPLDVPFGIEEFVAGFRSYRRFPVKFEHVKLNEVDGLLRDVMRAGDGHFEAFLAGLKIAPRDQAVAAAL